MGRAEHGDLVEGAASQLQADGHAIGAEPAWHRNGRHAGLVHRTHEIGELDDRQQVVIEWTAGRRHGWCGDEVQLQEIPLLSTSSNYLLCHDCVQGTHNSCKLCGQDFRNAKIANPLCTTCKKHIKVSHPSIPFLPKDKKMI